MKLKTLNEIAGVLVSSGREDLAEVIVGKKKKKKYIHPIRKKVGWGGGPMNRFGFKPSSGPITPSGSGSGDSGGSGGAGGGA